MHNNKTRVTDTHVYFWNGIFSNWYPSEFTMDGITFQTSEHAFMYLKAKFFNDDETAALILLADTPKDAKDLGRTIKNFNKDAWDAKSYDVMFYVNVFKFMQNQKLYDGLLETGNRTIVEASPVDIIWGVGLGPNDPLIDDEKNWKGQNLLGKALINTRDVLREDLYAEAWSKMFKGIKSGEIGPDQFDQLSREHAKILNGTK